MGLFTRSADAPVANTAPRGSIFSRREKPSVSTAGTQNINTTGVAPTSPYAFVNRRPTFGGWFKTVWLDILTMAVMGVIGLGVMTSDNFP